MLLCLWTDAAWGHVFPEHTEPEVGATVTVAPTRVRIWFNGALEPAFSTFHVQNSSGEQVDRGDGHGDPSDPTLLPPGIYRVFWSAVARDGHRTEGDYIFTIK